MSLNLKRVALDFVWPLDKRWAGYLNPWESFVVECMECGRTGYSPQAREMSEQWRGVVPYKGKTPLTMQNPMGFEKLRLGTLCWDHKSQTKKRICKTKIWRYNDRMIIEELVEKNIAHPPRWLVNNCAYLTIMGSLAYGTSSDSSDYDVYGFVMPPLSIVFPHTAGEIIGFGRQKERFEQWQEHHCLDKDALAGAGRSYDFTVFNIVKFFTLLMENNINCLDAIFTPVNCVLHSTKVGNLVRENRRIFLHKGLYHKTLGYAHSQLHKMTIKTPLNGSKRDADIQKNGFDTKFAMHLVRLSYEAEQLLSTGDMDIQRDREHLKAIRRGEIAEKEIRDWFSIKEKTLEKLYSESKLPHSPDEGKIKNLLLECLEHHYGSLDKMGYVQPDAAMTALREIKAVLEKNRSILGN